MIACENVSKIYPTRNGEVRSLDALTLEISPGEFLVVRGPSGSGKTTLLLALGGMLRPTSGNIVFDGQDIYDLSTKDRARFRSQKIGFVFQMFHLVPYLNVLENVLLAATTSANDGHHQRAQELFDRLDIKARAQHRPSELSAGERQRTAIARALLNEPKLILADEPTGNLDPGNTAEVFRHLSEYQKAGGTVIVVTHGEAANVYADRIVKLKAGKLDS